MPTLCSNRHNGVNAHRSTLRFLLPCCEHAPTLHADHPLKHSACLRGLTVGTAFGRGNACQQRRESYVPPLPCALFCVFRTALDKFRHILPADDDDDPIGTRYFNQSPHHAASLAQTYMDKQHQQIALKEACQRTSYTRNHCSVTFRSRTEFIGRRSRTTRSPNSHCNCNEQSQARACPRKQSSRCESLKFVPQQRERCQRSRTSGTRRCCGACWVASVGV